MKGKIIELKDNSKYVVLEEMEYNNKKFIIASECKNENEEINEEDAMIIMEVALDGDDLSVIDIYDDEVAATISKKMLEKMKTSSFE
ncbi:MAG: DUF1292 domain-containing protein [bacterium]|nr:DUF1292 domain-containing protein [bacterium]